MLIQIIDGTFYYNEKKIFENVSLQLNELDRIGLVGRNGEGKTTLIKALTKQYELRSGEVVNKSNLRYGYLAQNAGLDSNKTVYDEMLSVFDKVTEAERTMRELEKQMALLDYDSEEYKQKIAQYNAKCNFFEANDGYNVEVRIKTVLNGMGFADRYNQIINSMSGGEKTRLAICRLLLIAPELLIMDEPTNHLDFETLQWLEEYLSTYKGALLIVSHDRFFLDKLVTKMWDMENYGVMEFAGNFTKYRQLKEDYLERATKEYYAQQRKIVKMQEYAEKNIARDSTSNSAKSRLHQLANMDILDKPYIERRKPRFSFTFDEPSLKNAITVKNLNLYGGERKLLTNANLEILRGEKVALIGPNGAGKSTFIKQVMKASNDDYGRIRICDGVKLAYYDQENLNLNPNEKVLDAIWGTHYRMTQTAVRKILAQVLLSDEDINKYIKQLSGGERAKLGLAMMVIERANTLILDEPTNHLDLTSREALEEGLTKFNGTILFVSHDRYFINQVATKVVEIADQGFTVYDGNFDSYLLQKFIPSAKVEEPIVIKKTEKNYLNQKERKALTNTKLRIKELEQIIAELEQIEQRLNEEITLPEVVSDYKIMAQKCNELEQTKSQIENLLSEWEELSQQIG